MKFVCLSSLLLCVLVTSAWSDSKERDPRGYALYAPPPQFSYEARRAHPGNGVFELRLRPDGTVSAVAVLKSTGPAFIDQEAAATFVRWRFRPGTHSPIRIPLVFKR
jgi:TonB family protein